MIEPAVPEDGTCLQCGKPRNLAKLNRATRIHGERDPFCSATCCRVYYGCPLPVLSPRRIEEAA